MTGRNSSTLRVRVQWNNQLLEFVESQFLFSLICLIFLGIFGVNVWFTCSLKENPIYIPFGWKCNNSSLYCGHYACNHKMLKLYPREDKLLQNNCFITIQSNFLGYHASSLICFKNFGFLNTWQKMFVDAVAVTRILIGGSIVSCQHWELFGLKSIITYQIKCFFSLLNKKEYMIFFYFIWLVCLILSIWSSKVRTQLIWLVY